MIDNPNVPPAAEGLPLAALDSATEGADRLDAWALSPHGRNFLAHALVQLARDGWLRTEPGEGFEPMPEREPAAPAVSAVPVPPTTTTDRDALLRAADIAEDVAERLRARHEFERSTGALDVMTELRRMADETQGAPQSESRPPREAAWIEEDDGSWSLPVGGALITVPRWVTSEERARLAETWLARRTGPVGLRRMADETQQPSRCTCAHARAMHTGPNQFCAVPTCECTQYAGVRQAADTEMCGRTKSVCGTEYPPCGRPPGHQEAYCRSADGNAYFLAAGNDAPAPVRQPAAAEHTDGNAEDCPACTDTNPPYPFICPGPGQPAAAGTEETQP